MTSDFWAEIAKIKIMADAKLMELVVCMERRPDKFIFTKMFRGREYYRSL